jgi:hypothetical protein
MKSAIVGFLAAIVLGNGVAHANSDVQLRGKYGACQNNQKMGLWDISGNSPLIRDDMVRSNYCWQTEPGIRVIMLDQVGKFVRVTNKTGSAEYLVYRADIEKVPTEKAKPRDTSNRQIDKIQLTSVRNTVQNEVYDIGGKPTVQINVKADDKLQLYFSIVKSEITEGFDVRVEDQSNPKMQVGGKCDGATVGVGKPDFYQVRVTGIDQIKKRATLLISGRLNMCSLDSRHGYLINDAELVISGKNFTEVMRPHTQKELAKRFVPFKW